MAWLTRMVKTLRSLSWASGPGLNSMLTTLGSGEALRRLLCLPCFFVSRMLSCPPLFNVPYRNGGSLPRVREAGRYHRSEYPMCPP